MIRLLTMAMLTAGHVALAQAPEPKVIVVPYPGETREGEAPATPTAAPASTSSASPAPANAPAPAAGPSDVPAADPLPTRTIEAQPPLPTPPAASDDTAPPPPLDTPGAFLDGHPREGAFLSGPGSFAFILHHTLMTGVGVLATQMVPRMSDAFCLSGAMGCVRNEAIWTDSNARTAYLAGALIGAGVGFGVSAVWQFTHWINTTTATFGMVNSLLGGMFLGGLTDLITQRGSPTAISWLALIGAMAGGWLTPILGGGDLAMEKGVLIASGGAWGLIYTSLILAILASTGGGGNVRDGIDALMIVPAIGAAAMAFATLKFSPSTTQIMRANLFGVGVGSAVLLVAALVLGANFASPVPYILGGVAAIGAKVTVSLLWAEAAESPPPPPVAPSSSGSTGSRTRSRVSVWW